MKFAARLLGCHRALWQNCTDVSEKLLPPSSEQICLGNKLLWNISTLLPNYTEPLYVTLFLCFTLQTSFTMYVGTTCVQTTSVRLSVIYCQRPTTGCTNFLKISVPPQNSRIQKCHMKQVPIYKSQSPWRHGTQDICTLGLTCVSDFHEIRYKSS